MTSILVFSRDAEWYGGVVNFIESLRKCLGSDVEFTQFKIGMRKSAFGRIMRPFTPFFDTLRLVVLLFRRRFDSFHVNPSLNFSSLFRDGLFMLVLRLMGARNVIVTFHGWNDATERRIQNNPILRRLFIYCFGYARQTLVLSETFRQWLIDIGFDASNVHLFTTMFDDREFDNSGNFVNRNENSLLFLSRLVREKGMYELLDAFRVLAQEYPELKLVFAGNGPEEEALRKIVDESILKDRIRFLGYVRGQDKVRAFSESGIFVFPTLYGEGCPVSLLEAMASGLPVITTTVGGIPHIIEDGVNGLLLKEVSATAVETALRQLLDNAALRQSMAEQNFRDAWEKYSAPVVARIFEKLYVGESL